MRLATRNRRIVSVSMKIFVVHCESLYIYESALPLHIRVPSRGAGILFFHGIGDLRPLHISSLFLSLYMRRVPVSSLLLAPFPILHYFATLPIVFSPVLPRPSLKTISLVSLSRPRSSDLFLLPRVLFSRVA